MLCFYILLLCILPVANRNAVITLLKTVFSTLTIAMRYEPANAKFFATEVSSSYLSNTIISNVFISLLLY